MHTFSEAVHVDGRVIAAAVAGHVAPAVVRTLKDRLLGSFTIDITDQHVLVYSKMRTWPVVDSVNKPAIESVVTI